MVGGHRRAASNISRGGRVSQQTENKSENVSKETMMTLISEIPPDIDTIYTEPVDWVWLDGTVEGVILELTRCESDWCPISAYSIQRGEWVDTGDLGEPYTENDSVGVYLDWRDNEEALDKHYLRCAGGVE